MCSSLYISNRSPAPGAVNVDTLWLWRMLPITWKIPCTFGWGSVVLFISQCVSDHFLYKDHKWDNYRDRYCFRAGRDPRNNVSLGLHFAEGHWSLERNTAPPSITKPVYVPARETAYVYWHLVQAGFYWVSLLGPAMTPINQRKKSPNSGAWLFKVCWNLLPSLALFPILPSHFHHLLSPSTFNFSHFQHPTAPFKPYEWAVALPCNTYWILLCSAFNAQMTSFLYHEAFLTCFLPHAKLLLPAFLMPISKQSFSSNSWNNF